MPGVEKFFMDVLKMDPDDIICAFEHWGVLQGKSALVSFYYAHPHWQV